MTRVPLYQRRLTDKSIATKTIIHNIEAVGDPLTTKDDTTLRIAFQNIHGATDLRGQAVPSEIEAMQELNIDIMGMAETNRPWTNEQMALHDAYMNKLFQGSKTIYTAAPNTDHTVTYQPGGNLLTANGAITGRIDGRGKDKWGRFCWYSFKGQRDEGVVIITAYRVCQETNHSPGPNTAFSQQYIAMREEGIREPNPRKQILVDLETLIADQRSRGYRPILLIDANGDYVHGKDATLGNFLLNTGLQDPFLSRYKNPIRTYLRGSNRIDYIFMDGALTQSVQRIGYLGTHEGAISDHVMAYVDMDHHQMFAGTLNKPPPPHLRDIMIGQEDKIQAFHKVLHTQLDVHKIHERAIELATSFAESKATTTNIDKYNSLYGQFLEIVQCATSSVAKQPYGYLRSRTLSTAGNQVLLGRFLHDCKRRGVPPTKKLIALGKRLSVDVHALLELPESDIRKLMRKYRTHLWECQKRCGSLREEFLETEARNQAIACGDKDWEGRLRKMKSRLKLSAMNHKLTVVTKGRQGALTMIQVPTHDWFYCDFTYIRLVSTTGVK